MATAAINKSSLANERSQLRLYQRAAQAVTIARIDMGDAVYILQAGHAAIGDRQTAEGGLQLKIFPNHGSVVNITVVQGDDVGRF